MTKPKGAPADTRAMPSLPTPSVVLFVANVGALTAFYESLASMKRVAGDADHAVLEIAGFQLVIHRLRSEPEPANLEGRVTVREDSYTKVCLPVDSIAAARERASRLGGSIKPAKAEWEARGFRACDGHDPEGNVIQVREAAS